MDISLIYELTTAEVSPQGNVVQRDAGCLEQVKQLFAPWTGGKAPYSYSWFMGYCAKRSQEAGDVSIEDVVAAWRRRHWWPRYSRRVFDRPVDSGVDEVLLFMQRATTPHDKIKSIKLVASEVLPRVKQPEAGGA